MFKNMNIQFDGFIRNVGTYGEKSGIESDRFEQGNMAIPDKLLSVEKHLPYRRYITIEELASLAGVTVKGDVFPAHIEGRVFSPRGILPISFFPEGDKSIAERANLDNFWVKEIFYSFDLAEKYKAKKNKGFWATFFLQKPLNFPVSTPKYLEQTQSGTETNGPGYTEEWSKTLKHPEREPCIRSHARGLISRMDMDRIDGLQRDKKCLVTTDICVKRDKEYLLQELAAPTHFRTHTSLEVDCCDALLRTIYNQALGEFRLPVKQLSSGTKNMDSAQLKVRFLQDNIASTGISGKDENDITDKKTTGETEHKTSLKKKLRAAIKKLFCCFPQKTK
ncbi:uncharacterized protein LOC135461851 [Liolophura sinensis]|uniref:uncharacterized protein LOC135461851 n=1 Tax=Liolophura sinensis TaxID=3198878 RepID=UPI003158D110